MTKSYVSTETYTAYENLIIVGNWNSESVNIHNGSPDDITENFYGLNQAVGFPEKLVYFYRITALTGNADIPNERKVAINTINKVVSCKPWQRPRPRIVKEDNATVVFDGQGEGLPYNVVKMCAEWAEQNPHAKCFYLSGAVPSKITHDTFKEIRGEVKNFQLITTNVFSTNQYEGGYKGGYTKIKQDCKSDRPFKYHFFAGAPRPHRYMLLALLAERKVLDKGILSYGWSGSPSTPMQVLEAFHQEHNAGFYNNFKNIMRVCEKYFPTIPEMQCPYDKTGFEFVETASRIMPKKDVEIYNNTWFQVSTETSNITSSDMPHSWMYPSSRPLFLTEKTYRPLVLGHMGLTIGQQGHMKHLQLSGYQPFNRMRNIEKVDMIYNDEERLIAQADAIEDMCNWPDNLYKEYLTEFQKNEMPHNRAKIINTTQTYQSHSY